MRAEEIVIEVPDGQSVTTLVNATPIRSEEGEVVSAVVTLQDMTPLEEMERLRAEVWVTEIPNHWIHFNRDKFLGP